MKKIIVAMQVAFGFMLCWIILWAWLYYLPLPEVSYPVLNQSAGTRRSLHSASFSQANICRA